MKQDMENFRTAAPLPDHIALIGNSMPRRCGIATFTTHCHDALTAAFPRMRIDFYAMDDGKDGIEYPEQVHTIAHDNRTSYAEAANRIEASGAKAIWLQHEFGIFGGAAGDMILHLLERTRLPLLVTLHTVSATANADERRVLAAILRRANRIMVMAGPGRDILLNAYGVDEAIIAVIPHGVPDRPFVAPAALKPRLGWEGHRIILTFGLLAPDKGIDQMIRAMPAIVAKHPDTLYVVLGATHPNLVREQGEALRESLAALAEELGVGHHVRFIDRYVEQEELLDYLQGSDIYVTPYVNAAQVVSGTLSYAIGMGKPVLSTPYVQAREILADDRGVIVPFRDPDALAAQSIRLLSNDGVANVLAARAYAYGRGMIWSELARHVGQLLIAAIQTFPARFTPRRSYELLPPNPNAVLRMSDTTGMMQHSVLNVPDRNHGYCIDDNARALILMTQLTDMDASARERWMTVYASFIQHAWNADRGRFRNFMSYDRRWLEEAGSEDSCGRALWALGVTMRDAPDIDHRNWAARLFDTTLGALATVRSPRAQAFMILGIGAALDAQPGHHAARAIMEDFAAALMQEAEEVRQPDWNWFEVVLAYDNARLCEALLIASHHLNRDDFAGCGLSTLRWLVARQRSEEGYFRAIGSESFGRPFKSPLPFDQQPLEAQAMIDAAIAAFACHQDPEWVDVADAAYKWFLGQNDLDTPLATSDGGCYDGLTPQGVNLNQGAESLLALQLASCAMKRLSQRLSKMADTHSETPSVSA